MLLVAGATGNLGRGVIDKVLRLSVERIRGRPPRTFRQLLFDSREKCLRMCG
jgi:hypothetical protein